MPRKKKEECPSAPAWIISFSDLMSLLLTFFILLYSMSVLDIKKLMKFLWYFQGEEVTFATKTVAILPPINLLPKDIAKEVKKRIQRVLPIHAYQIAVIENYVLIRLFNDITFEEGDYRLTEKSKKALKDISQVLKALSKDDLEIRIEGHTSNHKNPWNLSVKRAVEVAQYLINTGVDPRKISASGYGDTRPIYTWNHPLLNRRNDRVEILIQIKKVRTDLSDAKKGAKKAPVVTTNQ
ncbi:MAG: flagellar motor protein MotB [Aquificae bacterium]|nr:flagellar motor protein MotB [Aquificota bacterium]